MIGIWATNPSVGDIFGQQIYTTITKNDPTNWGYTFLILGVCVQVVAILNFICLVEYPKDKGIKIDENASIFSMSSAQNNGN